MSGILGRAVLVIIGFGSGALISGAVFAFISAIGVVPRLAQKTGTASQIKLYETAMLLGGLFGAMSEIIKFQLHIGLFFTALFAVCVGIFYGVLAVSLAEVLDMVPILARRARFQKGMFFFVIAIALGKLTGSLLYAIVPGFHT
jgi:stage V sporulation protein AB